MAATRAPRRKRRREITAEDIQDLPIEEYTQEQSTKGSYSSYIGPFVDFTVEKGYTSPMYLEAMQRTDLPEEYVQQNEIRPICSSFIVESNIKVALKRWRDSGIVVVTSARPSFPVVRLDDFSSHNHLSIPGMAGNADLQFCPSKKL
jgi:hypothetical protein